MKAHRKDTICPELPEDLKAPEIPEGKPETIRSFGRDIVGGALLILIGLTTIGLLGYLIYDGIINIGPSYSTIAKRVCENQNLTLESYDGSSSRVTCALMRPYLEYNVTQLFIFQYDFKIESAKYIQNKTNKTGGN
jgi:hypothetical protein